MELILGIDLGTSYFKLGLFDRDGKMQGLGRVAVPVKNPEENRAEVEAEDFWQALRDGLAEALKQAEAAPEDIKALSYSTQTNSFILLDGKDKPLSPIVLWIDHRSEADECVKNLSDQFDFAQKTGLYMDFGPGLMITNLRWFIREQQHVWKHVKKVMTISDYLVWGLTDNFVGDAGSASLTGLLDITSATRWDKAFDILELPQDMFASIERPGKTAGVVSENGNNLIGLPQGIPLVLGSLDHHIAAIGAGAGSVGELSESTGTVLAVLKLAEKVVDAPGTIAGAGCEEGKYFQLAFSCDGASVLDKYCKVHGEGKSMPEIDRLAEKVSADCDGVKFADGEFSGPQDLRDIGHCSRAIMTYITETLKTLIGQLCVDENPASIVATGGGAKSDLWLQMKADIIDTRMIRTCCEEPATRGAAMLASVATGWFDNLDDVAKAWIEIKKVFKSQE